MPLTFEIADGGGLFQPGDDQEAVQELDEALDARDAGQLSSRTYVARLKRIIERHPDFIDGHAHLGFALAEEGKHKAALNAFQQGAAIGQAAVPQGFSGTIEWGWLENRPYLRALHGVALCHLKLGQLAKALPVLEQMLAFNPNDNQGVRYVIGSAYLRCGQLEKARGVFATNAPEYPPYWFELALLDLREDKPVVAATSLRQGFLANPYVAEMLCGCPEPMPLAIWHGSNFAEPELAREYLSLLADLWERTPGAIAFVRWLHTHPKVLVERAAILECQEALLWERDPKQRTQLIRKEEALREQIDDRLSKLIVQSRTDRRGQSVLPWLYPMTRDGMTL